jgi:hypothetical protein
MGNQGINISNTVEDVSIVGKLKRISQVSAGIDSRLQGIESVITGSAPLKAGSDSKQNECIEGYIEIIAGLLEDIELATIRISQRLSN